MRNSKKSSLPQENYILRPKLKLKCIPILAVVLIAYPENRLIGQIVDHAMDGVGAVSYTHLTLPTKA